MIFFVSGHDNHPHRRWCAGRLSLHPPRSGPTPRLHPSNKCLHPSYARPSTTTRVHPNHERPTTTPRLHPCYRPTTTTHCFQPRPTTPVLRPCQQWKRPSKTRDSLKSTMSLWLLELGNHSAYNGSCIIHPAQPHFFTLCLPVRVRKLMKVPVRIRLG